NKRLRMANNLGTLPTHFATNSVCSTEMGNIYNVYESSNYYLLQGPPLSIARCLPENYAPSANYFYRPATACPSGYTSACQSTAAIATLTDTYVTCCPTWQSTLGCVTSMPATTWSTSVIYEFYGTTSHGYVSYASGGINAYSVQIRYGAADATSTTSSATATSTLSLTPTSTTAPAPTTTDNQSSSGLSTGAAIGIGVGCTLAGLAIATAAVFVFMRKRRQRRDQAAVQAPAPYQPKVESQYAPTELPGYLSGPTRS
ncbi:hypothetical protein PG993_011509, partial [Apiospora rasikravindrae]